MLINLSVIVAEWDIICWTFHYSCLHAVAFHNYLGERRLKVFKMHN